MRAKIVPIHYDPNESDGGGRKVGSAKARAEFLQKFGKSTRCMLDTVRCGELLLPPPTAVTILFQMDQSPIFAIHCSDAVGYELEIRNEYHFSKFFPASLRHLLAERRRVAQFHQCVLEAGYRPFDIAQMYENEAETGDVLATSGIARGDLCITTRVHFGNFTTELFASSVEQSLAKLKSDYVDILLLHRPTPGGDIQQSLELLEEVLAKGWARNIGISNHTVKMMKQAISMVTVPLVTRQVELHPVPGQSKLLAAVTET